MDPGDPVAHWNRGALCGGPSVDSAIQGILVTGGVYGNQLVKQLGKRNTEKRQAKAVRFFF
ncbi:MAG: hypothetical protein ACLRXC_11115 [[Clostridium] leptum]